MAARLASNHGTPLPACRPTAAMNRQRHALSRCRQLWLAILLTAIGVGVILWGVERWANVRPPPPGEPPFPKLQPQVFGALGRPMQVGGGEGPPRHKGLQLPAAAACPGLQPARARRPHV